MVLATAFPVIMPVILTQLVNGSLLTTVLRLRAAHRELAAQKEARDEQQPIGRRRADHRTAARDGSGRMNASESRAGFGIGCGGRCARFRAG